MKTLSSPEHGFILSCLDSLLRPGRMELAVPAGLDWQKFVDRLNQDRLAALFYSISRDHPGLFPASVRQELQKSRYANLLYGDGCRSQIREVLGAFKDAGIPVIVLKGWAYMQWLYNEDHGQRFTEDIDLLTLPERVDQAEEILASLGYQGSLEVVDGYSREYANARAYSKLGSRVANFRLFSIGLHWGLTHYPRYDPSRVDVTELFARSLPIKVAGVDVLELSPEDGLIYACAHLALHHRNQETYLNYYEMAALLLRLGRIPAISLVIQRSLQWKYFLQVRHVLLQVERLFPGTLSGDDFARLKEVHTPLKDRWVDWLVASTGGRRYPSALLEILFLPGLRAKIHALRLQLFPPASYLNKRYQGGQPGKTRLYCQRLSSAFKGFFRSGRNG